MPIHLGKDSKGPFVQWGHQKKYHYKANDKQSLANAKSRAKKQMKAIFSSGYVGQSINDTICQDCSQSFNWKTQVDYIYNENGQLIFKCPACGSENLHQLENNYLKKNIPQYLYHATYRPLLRKIKQLGLGNTKRTYWQDSKPGVVYLADDPDVAESYADTNQNLRNEDWLNEIVVLQINTDLLDKTKLFVDQNVKLDEGQTNSTWQYHGVIPWQNLKLINKNILYQNTFNYQTQNIYHKEEQLAKGREKNTPLEKMDKNKLIQLKNQKPIYQSKFDKLFKLILEDIEDKNIYYHISPYKFNNFKLNKCGIGMGTSFWGYGLYFCKNEDIIDYYYDQMKNNYSQLYKYTVKINCKTHSQILQTYTKNHIIQNKTEKLIYKQNELLLNNKTVGEIYYQLAQKYGQKDASQIISNKYNVAGIEYYTEEDDQSLVVYDQSIIQILNIQEIHDEQQI